MLCRNGKAQDLTSDHRPFGRDKKSFLEVKRIQEAGGWVRNWCVRFNFNNAAFRS